MTHDELESWILDLTRVVNEQASTIAAATAEHAKLIERVAALETAKCEGACNCQFRMRTLA